MANKKITAIEVQAKRKDRFSIFIDDEFAFGIHQDVLLQSGIARGDEISDEKIAEILALEQKKSAKEKAMRLLAVRARSRKELADRLVQAKYPQEVVDWVLQELERLGLLDDEQFALMFARSRMITRPEGSFLLRQELKQKGVADDIIEKTITKIFKEKSESQVAWELARKRKKSLQSTDEDKARKRLSDFLLRRGFHWDVVKDVIENWEEI